MMLTTIWAKYLPVLRIVLKKSLTADQVLALNQSDFERAGHKRKTSSRFEIELKEGRLSNVLVGAPVAASLATALLEDAVVKKLTETNTFRISMDSKYQLAIKYIPHEIA